VLTPIADLRSTGYFERPHPDRKRRDEPFPTPVFSLPTLRAEPGRRSHRVDADPRNLMNKEVIDEVLTGQLPDRSGFLYGRLAWAVCCALVLVLALVVALPGIERIPLDSHEIFVAQTTREMSARGDWLVPYFNGMPRLNKPPMSYWFTGLVAALAGSLPDVAPIHARLVSVFAGLGIVVLTLWLGARLFDRATALIASLLLISSAGFFSFTHDARPDLLYAFFTSAMLATGIVALRGVGTLEPGRAGIYAMWGSFALATLTKGPHMPALALLGLLSNAALTTRQPRQVWRALRPLHGIAIVALPSLAWWGWLRLQIDADTLGHSQLMGSLLAPAWSRLGAYYLYRPLQLLLPWLPLAVLALGGLALRPSRRDTGWLWWPLLIAALGLSFGSQFRHFYMLPLIVPLMLVIARPLAVLFGAALQPWPRQLLQLALVVQGLLALACAGWALVASGRIAYLTPPILSLLAGLACSIATWRGLRLRDGAAPAMRGLAALAATAVFVAWVWPGAALTGVPWSRGRFEDQALADAASAEVMAGRTLVTLGVSPSLYVYAANARVQPMGDVSELAERAATGLLAAVVRSDRLVELSPPLVVTELGRARRGSHHDVLVRVDVRR